VAAAFGVLIAPATALAQTTSAAGQVASPPAPASSASAPAPSSPASPLVAPPTNAPPLPPPAPTAPATTDAVGKPSEAPPAATEETPIHAPHAANTARTIGWISIAIGAEAAITAVVTSAMALHEKGVRDDNCNAAKVCSQTGIDANVTLGTLFGWNTASWIVGVAGLGVGTVLVLTSRPIKNDQVALTVGPTSGGAAVALTGQF
jgi:hypothetical protein